jgi:divalent metal cation (Fe/Co/Zn/Cd) transporter
MYRSDHFETPIYTAILGGYIYSTALYLHNLVYHGFSWARKAYFFYICSLARYGKMNSPKVVRIIALLIVLSIVGGVLKIYGSIVGGSKSVFVDAATSIANTIAILMILKFFKEGMEPPDRDHHYGHHRLAVGGSISMLMLYSFVAGVVTVDLINSLGKTYKVGYESPIYASIAIVPYGLAVLMAKRSYSIVSSYGGFTAIELIESIVSILSSLGGVAISYTIDFSGAIVLTGYLFYELVGNLRQVVIAISDVAPKDVIDRIIRVAKDFGVDIERIRVRRIIENIYHGDIVIKIEPGIPIEEAHSVADTIEKELRKQGIDVVVHVEPSKTS